MIYVVISPAHLYPMDLNLLINSHSLYHISQWCSYSSRLHLHATCKTLHSLTPEFKDLSIPILRRLYSTLFQKRIEELKLSPKSTPAIKHRQTIKNHIAEELAKRKAPFFFLEVCFVNHVIPYPPAQEAMIYSGLGKYDGCIIPAHGKSLFLHIDITKKTRSCDVHLLSPSHPKTTILKVFSSSRDIGSWGIGRKRVLHKIPLEEIYVQIIKWFVDNRLQG